MVYLTWHDEAHSLPINMDIDTMRFWMGWPTSIRVEKC